MKQIGAGADAPAGAGAQISAGGCVAVAQLQRDAAAFLAAAFNQLGQCADVVMRCQAEAHAAGEALTRGGKIEHAVGHDAQRIAAAVIVAADFAFHNQHAVGFQTACRFFEHLPAHHHFGLAVLVFHGGKGDFAAPSHHGAHGGNEAGHAHMLLRLELVEAQRGKLAHFGGKRAKRVAGKVKAEHLFFFGELFRFTPFGRIGKLHRLDGVFHHVKQAALVGIGRFLFGVAHGQIDVGQKHGAIGVDAVKRAAAYERFHRAFVDVRFAYAFAKVEQILKRPAALPCGHNRFHRRFARAFHRAEGIADLALVVGGETVIGLVDIGRQKFEAVGARVIVKKFELVGVVQFARHGGGHKFGRIMRFEPGGLVGHQRIGGGVRFVEAVAGEFFHIVENFVGFLLRNAFFSRAGHKSGALLHHFFHFFLAHGAAQQIRAAQRVAADHLRRLHHLLLIHHNAVSGREHVAQKRVQVFKARAVHAVDKIGYQIHRPRTVERHKGDNLFKLRGLGLLQHFFHAGGFKLKHGGGVGGGKNFVGGRIIKRNLAHVHFFAGGLGDKVLRHFDNGEVAQAQKVEFHQAHVFHIAFVIHRHR